MGTEPEWPPPGSRGRRHKVLDAWLLWWHAPLFIWFRMTALWGFLALGILYLAASWSLCSFELGAQFMMGHLNPFNPPKALGLDPIQQAWAVVLRVMGWLAAPAFVGASAGLAAAEFMRRLFNREPDAKKKRKRRPLRRCWRFLRFQFCRGLVSWQTVARFDELRGQLARFAELPVDETSPEEGTPLLDRKDVSDNPDLLRDSTRKVEAAILRADVTIHGDPDGTVATRLAELDAQLEAAADPVPPPSAASSAANEAAGELTDQGPAPTGDRSYPSDHARESGEGSTSGRRAGQGSNE